MKRTLKKSISLLLVALMLISGVPAFAQGTSFSDIQGHWASEKIVKWATRGIISGFEDGTFRPNNNITRAEFAKILNGVFGFQNKSDQQFADVSSNAWYADELLKAREAGYFKGSTGNMALPNERLTRQDAATMLARVFNLKESNSAENFKDAVDISGYAKGAVGALVQAGAINGLPDGTFKPKNPITRAETIKIIDELVKGYYNSPGTFS
ncbi:S-layer homology domain-containing protein [Thermoanaerobacterium sp. DL9XJH110]|uniref:S-layer homology domain-containing protein n=1 Tax=Thermoanaerobacterium sp. DL9XJH110 TaxID=3386643 RepID=UPI003BB760EC